MLKGSGWNWASLYWLIWMGIGFLPLEMWALFSGNPQDTLSDQVWRLTGQGTTTTWTFGHYMILVFCIWLLGHFAFGWWRG